MDIRGKRVLLTGATGGIGRAIAQALAAEGAQLVLTGRRTEQLEALRAGLKAQTLTVDFVRADAISQLLQQSGDIDILVACAGLPATARFTDCPPDEIERVLQVNLQAPMQLARALIPGMQARGLGHLVFVSSMAGKISSPLSVLYSTSKFGLRGFAQCLRIDLHRSSISVSCIFPGIIRNAGMFVETGATPPPGIGTNTPEDVAQGVIRAIRFNKAEVDVAPLLVRFWAWFSSVAPGWSAAVQRRFGAEDVVEHYTAGKLIRK